MKKILMFHFASCPYCRAAMNYLQELTEENPEFATVEIEKIDEKIHPEIADKYDYWYVPTFYVDGQKVHEGACTKKIVENVLRASLS